MGKKENSDKVLVVVVSHPPQSGRFRLSSCTGEKCTTGSRPTTRPRRLRKSRRSSATCGRTSTRRPRTGSRPSTRRTRRSSPPKRPTTRRSTGKSSARRRRSASTRPPRMNDYTNLLIEGLRAYITFSVVCWAPENSNNDRLQPQTDNQTVK